MLSYSSFTSQLYSRSLAEEWSTLNGTPLIAVESDPFDISKLGQPRHRCSAVVAAIVPNPEDYIDHANFDFADVIIDSTQLETLQAAVYAAPHAASTLVQLLRVNEQLDIEHRLVAESLAYSTLQHGVEFQSWLADRPKKIIENVNAPSVLTTRSGSTLEITLNRPERRNAYSSTMRDGLCEALELALIDQTIAQIQLQGRGPCFSAGGDLDEFGEALDASIAHLSRTTRSAGHLMHLLHDRTHVHLHGACIGAGIELPAFAGSVEATQNAFFQLPEVSMGLIPGAGGTASILQRIGRHRFNYMALTGCRVTANTALDWGLVDVLSD